MAILWKLPCIYVIENNKYGMGTPIDRSSANTKFYTKGQVCPGVKINGNNVFGCREVFKWAKDYALENGPIFIELETYRYHGHSMSDPGITYRSREEIQDYRQNHDCIELVRNMILENKMAEDKELKKIEKDIRKTIEDDVEKIKKDPMPGDEEMYSHIYKDQGHHIRGVEYHESKMV
jgi:pyruvate dehydrogenase E1 component alpha subunit